MKIIYKYNLETKREQQIQLPADAYILHFGVQDMESLCIWAQVNPKNKMEFRTFKIFGTGQEILDHRHQLIYIGTAITAWKLVWHLFEFRLP